MEAATIVRMKNICKSFPGVKALDGVDFELKSGEVMALLGENGAGKSTLVKILSGVYSKDSGSIEIFGKQVENLTTKSATAHGIAIIHQELNLCGHLTVAENVFLGHEPVRNGRIDTKEMNKQTADILKWMNSDISPETTVNDLAVSKQQIVEIAKALSKDAKILIMDEPTSALTASEIKELFEVIRKLRAKGSGIIYISHRLEELEDIVDRVTIMRDGKLIQTGSFSSLTMDDIVRSMIGREITEKFPRVQVEKGSIIFKVENLNAGKMVRNINFELRAGEIVGVAGLMGAGRTEMSRAVFGADKKEIGRIFVDGQEIEIHNPKDAIRAGVVLVPEDRKLDGLCTKLSVKENISLPNLDILSSKIGSVKRRAEKQVVETARKNLSIKMAEDTIAVESLSGGNQQKVVVAKWLARDFKVVIFDEPTRGIDVAAKVEIYNLINHLKEQGKAVMIISSEMPEVLGVSDRIIVMCDGRITGELDACEASQEKVFALATQFEKKT